MFPRLNNYLKLTATKQQEDDMTRVYVLVEDGGTSVLGYHAINPDRMDADDLVRRPRGLPDHGEIPILFVGQVAVDRRAQGHGFGGILMHHIFEKAHGTAETAGCHAPVLDVIHDGDDAVAGGPPAGSYSRAIRSSSRSKKPSRSISCSTETFGALPDIRHQSIAVAPMVSSEAISTATCTRLALNSSGSRR